MIKIENKPGCVDENEIHFIIKTSNINILDLDFR